MRTLWIGSIVLALAVPIVGQVTKTPGEIVPGAPERTAQFSGFFTLVGQFGHVVPLGYLPAGSSVEMTPVVLELVEGSSDMPCRLKVTLWIMGANNRTGQQRVIRRTAQLGHPIQINGTRIPGEGVVVLQAQNPNHVCLGSLNVDVF